MPQELKRHKTIVISDVHLGLKWSKTTEVIEFLSKNSCETLILCGDIIDGWAILRSKKEKWKQLHSQFAQLILNLAENTKVYYLRGNHDDFLSRLTPMIYHNISVIEDMIYESLGKKYYVFHGDRFDNVTSAHKWLSKLGDIGYSTLLHFNNLYNRNRRRNGKSYHSISADIKSYVKSLVSQHSDYENQIVKIAEQNQCDGVICGHTHQAMIKKMDKVLYLNSGDWVESLTALTEDFSGQWTIEHYAHI